MKYVGIDIGSTCPMTTAMDGGCGILMQFLAARRMKQRRYGGDDPQKAAGQWVQHGTHPLYRDAMKAQKGGWNRESYRICLFPL